MITPLSTTSTGGNIHKTDMKVTVFKDFVDTKAPHVVGVMNVLERIKTGGDKKEFIDSIRDLKTKKERDEQKKKLPVICFNGTFSQRDKEHLIEASGLMVIDFDGVEDMQALRTKIESKPYTFANFRSPSGNGYKSLFRIPKVMDDKEFKTYFKAVKQQFPELDDSGKDISRACFFTYDKDIFINRHATEFRLPDVRKLYKVKNWDKVNQALRKIEDSVEGEKHLVRTKIAYLFGGWVASKAMSYDDALSLIEASVAKNTTDFPAAMKTVRECLLAGMSQPLSLYEEKQALDMKVGIGKLHFDLDDVWDKVKEFYKNGYQRGFDTGWDVLDAYYSVLLGSTTIVYGAPYSGKSQLFHEIYVNLAKLAGLNIAMVSPETGEVHNIFGELISIYVGQSFQGDYKMSEQERDEAAEFIKSHFFVIDSFGEDFTYRDVLTQVEAIERTHGIKIHIISVDPLNYLDHINPNLRSDKAQDKDLDVFNADARKNQRHNVIITHTRDRDSRVERDRDTKEIVREWLPMPKPRDILNGQSFYRKGMNMVGVWRPIDFDDNPLPDHEVNELVIDIAKVKPKGVGRVGRVSLYYDFKCNRYYSQQNGQRVYAQGFTPPQQPKSEAATRLGGWDATPDLKDAPF